MNRSKVRGFENSTDEACYWAAVQKMAERVVGWERGGYRDLYHAIHTHVESHLKSPKRQRQVIRWTDHLGAIDTDAMQDFPGNASSAVNAIAYYSLSTDVEMLVEAHKN